ncbi:hypothetical protein BBOU_0611 [Bifidobacterium boum]|uniref:Uncharacterized protein n=1 Tax=Bifidobacterium boum TaxID=78343 RepID=A0A086ZPN2_9BIFI|nr:hypothetical protein BBOU_0611 [Bifidobacterium boum]
MRGEHHTLDRNADRNQGSSPHARGTQDGIASRYITSGIIPACAGNTSA